MEDGRKLIGRFGVDSGQVLIGDPCYLSDWKDNDYNDDGERTHEYSYNGACHETLSDEGAGTLRNGAAIVASTGYGDGEYPVYATIKNGRIMKLEIDFEGEDEFGDEEEG